MYPVLAILAVSPLASAWRTLASKEDGARRIAAGGALVLLPLAPNARGVAVVVRFATNRVGGTRGPRRRGRLTEHRLADAGMPSRSARSAGPARPLAG